MKHHTDDYDFFPLARKEIQVGDLYANHGTVTEVHVGPYKHPTNTWMSAKRGEVLVVCGESFSCKGKNANKIVIGRRREASSV